MAAMPSSRAPGFGKSTDLDTHHVHLDECRQMVLLVNNNGDLFNTSTLYEESGNSLNPQNSHMQEAAQAKDKSRPHRLDIQVNHDLEFL